MVELSIGEYLKPILPRTLGRLMLPRTPWLNTAILGGLITMDLTLGSSLISVTAIPALPASSARSSRGVSRAYVRGIDYYRACGDLQPSRYVIL